MARSSKRTFPTFGRWQRAATIGSAILAFGLVATWPGERAPVATPADTPLAAQSCSQGDEVSRFVCRNTWMANLRRSYR
jgi:hypothetical protein